jgi:hypothetical protein
MIPVVAPLQVDPGIVTAEVAIVIMAAHGITHGATAAAAMAIIVPPIPVAVVHQAGTGIYAPIPANALTDITGIPLTSNAICDLYLRKHILV